VWGTLLIAELDGEEVLRQGLELWELLFCLTFGFLLLTKAGRDGVREELAVRGAQQSVQEKLNTSADL